MTARKIPLVAIVGRTNVGKSTLFNALAGKRISVIEDSPGVTRDRHYELVTRHGFPFTLIDTGGLVGEEDSEFRELVRTQTEIAIEEADLILAIFDGIHGLHPLDEEVVQRIRLSKKPVLWVVNKCEKPESELIAAEVYSTGVDEITCVSAAHNVGIRELIKKIKAALSVSEDTVFALESAENPEAPIRIAIVGKPNVGKSTLTNTLLGEKRMITSAVAGTTRDSIHVPLTYRNQKYVLVDTAGLRRKARVEDHTVERYSNIRTLRALVQCDVAVLLLDATDGLPSEQDAKIASLVDERALPLIIVVNKWDAIEKDHKTAKAYEAAVQSVLQFAKYAPILFVSAETGKRATHVLDKAREVYTAARTRIQTSELNTLLERAFIHRPPPVHRGQPIKFYFATQIAVAPPTIMLFVNFPKKVSFSYLRYIKSAIRDQFPFPGSNIKLVMRKRSDRSHAAERSRDTDS